MVGRCGRRHPVSGIIDIDIVPQMSVIKDKRTFREVRAFIPEHVDVADAVRRPHIELGSVPGCCFQWLPVTHERFSNNPRRH